MAGFWATVGKGVNVIDKSADVVLVAAEQSLAVVDNSFKAAGRASQTVKKTVDVTCELADEYLDINREFWMGDIKAEAYVHALEKVSELKEKGFNAEMIKAFYPNLAPFVDAAFAAPVTEAE